MTTVAANLLYLQLRQSPRLAGLKQPEIARKAKIHQSQVSRILRGQFKRVTAPSVMKLCEFARIKRMTDRPLSPKLQNVLRGVWDGSSAQEQALVRLLKAGDALALAHSATDLASRTTRTKVPKSKKSA
jgi:transcriptional regulator with XRE-family HTH domain